MTGKWLCTIGLLTGLLVAPVLAGDKEESRADSKDIKSELADIEKKLAPAKKLALAEPDVKAAQEAVKAAQEKYQQTLEAAMVRVDPNTKTLLEKRKQLLDQMAAEKKTATKPRKDK